MSYIDLAKRFWKLHEEENFSPGESHLYLYLVNLFSEKGTGKVWPEFLKMTDGTLASAVGMNVKTMDKVRGGLSGRGLIITESTGQGNRSGCVYRLVPAEISASTSPRTYVKKGEVLGEVSPLTSVKNGEVNAQLPHELLQEHTQKMEKSQIYIRNSRHQTPDNKQQQQSAPEGADGDDVENEVPDFVKKNRLAAEGFRPPSPGPLPPSEEEVRAGLLTSAPHQRYATEKLKLAKTEKDYADLVETFLVQQLAGTQEGRSPFEAGYRRHFMNWLGKQVEINQNAKTNGPTKQTSPNRGRPATALTQTFGDNHRFDDESW